MKYPRLLPAKSLSAFWFTLALAGCANPSLSAPSAATPAATPVASTPAVAPAPTATPAPAVVPAAVPAPTPVVAIPVTTPAPVAAAPRPAATPAMPVTTNAEPPGPRANPAINPIIQRGTDARHQSFVAIAQKGDVDLLFMGDSITDFWRSRGKAVWDQYYGNLKAANFGISADRTQNVLWRLQNGEGQGFTPKVVVMMIGTNNTGVENRRAVNSAWRNTNAEAIEGVTADVAELRKDFPEAKILLLSIFPRGDDALAMKQIPEINQGIAKLDDQQHVFYLDVTAKFLGPDGQINPDLFLAADRLHPTPAGYTVWAEAIKEPLAKLLK